MENQARQMIAARFQAVQIAVEHVGKPGQGVPEARMRRGEGPADTLRREAALNVAVVGHIDRVIEVDKIVLPDLPEDREGRHCQQQANRQYLFFLRHQALLQRFFAGTIGRSLLPVNEIVTQGWGLIFQEQVRYSAVDWLQAVACARKG